MMPLSEAAEADRSAILATLHAYQAALNAADTNAVLPLYEPDGVFMQPYGPSPIGTDQIRQADDADFRANSAGTNTILATGARSAEANRELFVFHKTVGASWITRYSFSITNPPRA